MKNVFYILIILIFNCTFISCSSEDETGISIVAEDSFENEITQICSKFNLDKNSFSFRDFPGYSIRSFDNKTKIALAVLRKETRKLHIAIYDDVSNRLIYSTEQQYIPEQLGTSELYCYYLYVNCCKADDGFILVSGPTYAENYNRSPYYFKPTVYFNNGVETLTKEFNYNECTDILPWFENSCLIGDNHDYYCYNNEGELIFDKTCFWDESHKENCQPVSFNEYILIESSNEQSDISRKKFNRSYPNDAIWQTKLSFLDAHRDDFSKKEITVEEKNNNIWQMKCSITSIEGDNSIVRFSLNINNGSYVVID